MNPTDLYRLWAPEDSIWSNWAKPILFTEAPIDYFGDVPDWKTYRVAWAPSREAGNGIVLDLPGADSVWAALALASRGFRPVPLFDGAPGSKAVIDVGPIVGAIQKAAADLGSLKLPADAPPVFLLDSRRTDHGALLMHGDFDNRWVIFPQDFPSANFLLSRGIRSMILAQEAVCQPRSDLAHAMLRWQQAGVQILVCDVRKDDPPQALQITRPGNFRRLWYRALVLAGLRRNSAGGFGGRIPEASDWGAGG